MLNLEKFIKEYDYGYDLGFCSNDKIEKIEENKFKTNVYLEHINSSISNPKKYILTITLENEEIKNIILLKD